MTEDQLNAALQAEYLQLQKTIEDFDGRALTIKAWSVTFGLVALSSAFATHAPVAFLMAAISASLFWALEIQWKQFQVAHGARSGQIEAHFRGERKIEFPFQIATTWSQTWNNTRSSTFLRIMRWPHVALPHAVVVGLAFMLFILSMAGVIKL